LAISDDPGNYLTTIEWNMEPVASRSPSVRAGPSGVLRARSSVDSSPAKRRGSLLLCMAFLPAGT
ncbi:hypothetical protein ACWEGQ_34295, partial [Streptomyces seoulensis]